MTHGIYIKIRKLKRNETTAITADINKVCIEGLYENCYLTVRGQQFWKRE